MKTKLLSLIFAFLLLSSMSYAQDEIFKVLASKGANKIVSAKSTEQKPVLIGKKLFKEDKIIVGENSYLGLAHKSGKTIELKKAGTYEIGKLSSELASQNAGVAKKYVDFVAGELSSTDEDMAKNRHKYMAVTGSVERDIKRSSAIKVLTPKDVFTLSTPVKLRWVHTLEATNTYVVTLTDMAEDTLYTIETKENFVIVDLEKLNIKKEKNILWKVAVKDSQTKIESEVAILKYVDKAKAATLEKQVAEIKAELSEETALNKLVLASFYEENGLILDALASYEAAIELEPTVEDYKIAYGKFLERKQLVVVAN